MRFLQTLLYSLICDAHNWMLNKQLRVCRICVLLAQKWEGFSNIILGLAAIATKIGHKGGISSDRPPTLPPIFGKNYVDTF